MLLETSFNYLPAAVALRALPPGPAQELYAIDAVARADRLAAVKAATALNIRIRAVNFHHWRIHAEYPNINSAERAQWALEPLDTVIRKRGELYVLLRRQRFDLMIHNFIGLKFGNGATRILIRVSIEESSIENKLEENGLRPAVKLVNHYNTIKKSYLKLCADLSEDEFLTAIVWIGTEDKDGAVYDKFMDDNEGIKLIRREE